MNDPVQQPPDPIECPFCHNKYSPRLYGWHERLEESGKVEHRYAVRCLNCGARGPRKEYGHLAIEAWNNRERSWLEKKPAAPAPDSGGWISVNESLPKDHAWVLVFADGAVNCMGYTPGKGFEDWVMQQAPNIVTSEITHWRELPGSPATR
jgi:hypothetical protein